MYGPDSREFLQRILHMQWPLAAEGTSMKREIATFISRISLYGWIYIVFFLQFDPLGERVSMQLSGNLSTGRGIAVDGADNIYVSGYTFKGFDEQICSGNSDTFAIEYQASAIPYSSYYEEMQGTALSRNIFRVK
jgi:hypothetical protein